MLLLRCPHCATVFNAGNAGSGALVGCPSCRRPCQVPKFAAALPVVVAPPSPPPSPVPTAPEPLDIPADLRLVNDYADHAAPPPARRPREARAAEAELLADGLHRLREESQPPAPADVPVLEVEAISPDLGLDDAPPPPPPPAPAEPEPAPAALVHDPSTAISRYPDAQPAAVEEVEVVEEEGEVLEEVEEVRTRPRKLRRRTRVEDISLRGTTRGLDTVNLGLGFHYARMVAMLAGIAILMLALVLGLLAMTFAGVGSKYDSASRASARAAVMGVSLVGFVFVLVNILVSFITPVLGLVGTIFCLRVPEKARCRGILIASLTLDGAAEFMGLILNLIGLLVEGETSWGLVMLLPFVLGTVAWVLFMIFLRRLSYYVDEDKLADEASELIVRGIIILVLAPFVIATVVGLAGVGRLLGLILAVNLLVFCVYYFFQFLRRQLDLIGSLRQVIETRC